MVYQASLVCEGGAMAGVYTAGVLDVLMEHDIYFSHVIGVSIGSCNAIDFASGQIGRTIDCMAVKDKNLIYAGLPCLLRWHKLYDFDMCFQGFADQYIPFDYEAFGRSPIYTEVVATDCETGEPLYIPCKAENKQVIRASRASSSLPFVSEVYEFEGHKCLDGGVAKSIPIDRAIGFGNEKIIVILTKPAGYRKTPNSPVVKAAARRKYRSYPRLQAALDNRYIDYNTDIEHIEKMADSGELYLFRPTHKLVKRHESQYEKLRAGYDEARRDAEQRLGELVDYLENKGGCFMKQYSDKNAVFALLDREGIPYHKQEHGATHTIKDVGSSGVVREGIVLKNLFLKDGKGKRHFLVCVPETTDIDLRWLGEQIGAKKLGLASPERMEKYLGVTPG